MIFRDTPTGLAQIKILPKSTEEKTENRKQKIAQVSISSFWDTVLDINNIFPAYFVGVHIENIGHPKEEESQKWSGVRRKIPKI